MDSCSRIGTLNLLPPATCRLGCVDRISVSNSSSPLSNPGDLARCFSKRGQAPTSRPATSSVWLRSPQSAAGLTTTFTAPSDEPETIHVQSDFHSQLDVG